MRILWRFLFGVLLAILLAAGGVQAHEDDGPVPGGIGHGLSGDPSDTGELSPLIPFHKDAIHASVLWRGDHPELCFAMRPTEYRGTDLVDPAIGPMGELRSPFERLVYGGFRFSRGPNGLDESVTTRVEADIARENVQCMNLSDSHAFDNPGKFNVADLTPDDFALNAGVFSDAGSSRGLNYNVFCSGNVLLADGRLMFIGGHDKSGNNGIRKLNIFDPKTDTWVQRPIPPVKRDYLADPTGTAFAHADALNESNTDPPDPSDMKYQRWYPSGVALPDGRVLILSGTDQDSSVGPANAAGTKIRMAVPEVYDPKTDTTVALENARKLFAMYPRSYVVQTGHHKSDWKVAVTAEVQPPLPTGADLRGYDPFTYNGNTYLLDVKAALADPNRDVPAEHHWQLVDTAQFAHESGAGAAVWRLDRHGHATSQRVVSAGGDSGTGDTVAAVETIDYQNHHPAWHRADDLAQPATQNLGVALPDGKVLILGGRTGRGSTLVNSFWLHMLDPATGDIDVLGEGTVPRHDHSTALLMPDATVIVMGGNRTDLVPGNLSAGVPVAQIYRPAYLFKGHRPHIEDAPDGIKYQKTFHVEVSSDAAEIASVALSRIGPVTHNWDWGNRLVRLSVRDEQVGKKHGGDRSVSVRAPALPGLAVPGWYMLFAVDKHGVPSVAKFVHLG